ncbi:MAG: hypothetical protein ACHRHE_07080 [Tepidisphaerales bacterium]
MSQNKPQFSCPACGRKFPWKAESAGRQGKCKCGHVLTVPAKAEGDPEPIALEEAAAPVAAPEQANCPGCGAAMEPGAVLCLNCGYNTRTGGQMTTEVAGGEAAPAATAGRAADAYPGRRRRGPAEKESGGSTKMYVILGCALLLLAMGVGGWFVYQGTGGGKANVPRLGDDAKVEHMIETETATDLQVWIKANPKRMLAGKTPGQALALEDRLKEMGATKVMAFGVGVMSLSIAIELPKDPAQRKELFSWFNRNNHPMEPTPPAQDVGQRYLLLFPGL